MCVAGCRDDGACGCDANMMCDVPDHKDCHYCDVTALQCKNGGSVKPNVYVNYNLFVQDAALMTTAHPLIPFVATREENTSVAATQMTSVGMATSVRNMHVWRIWDATALMTTVLVSTRSAPILLPIKMTSVSGAMGRTVSLVIYFLL